MQLGKFDVEVEYLDEKGNVWDSSAKGFFDNIEEAEKFAETIELSNEFEQVAIWKWDENEEMVEDSWVVKVFEK